MRSQSGGEAVIHHKNEHNGENVEEYEREEYGVRKTVKKLVRGSRAKERGMGKRRLT